MPKMMALAAALALLAAPAWASSCPTHMKKIDAALAQNPSLGAAKLAEVKKLRADGEALHKAGKHADSEAALRKAEAELGIK
jgi:hypothetical protein